MKEIGDEQLLVGQEYRRYRSYETQRGTGRGGEG